MNKETFTVVNVPASFATLEDAIAFIGQIRRGSDVLLPSQTAEDVLFYLQELAEARKELRRLRDSDGGDS